MERVTGIGGVFFRARDPEALVAWYAEHLGVPLREGYVVFPESRDTHWVPFAEDTEYWPAEKQHMVNFTVRDLDAMLAQPARRWGRGGRADRGARVRPLRLGGRSRREPLRALAAHSREGLANRLAKRLARPPLTSVHGL